MYCSKINCSIRNNKNADTYNCDNIYCNSRQCKTYHDTEVYIKNQGEKTIKNPAK
jgi:hypothetical protein